MDLYHNIETNIKDGISLFGAGQNGKWCFEYLKERGYKINCFIDNSPQNQSKFIDDIPIISRADFLKKPRGIVLITAKHAVVPILNDLRDYNLKMPFDAWFYAKNKQKYCKIREKLYDKKSKSILDNIVKTMLSGDEKFCAEIAEVNQYFCVPNFFNTCSENFVDLGAYVGDTVEKFIHSQNGTFKHIYAFEPAKKQFLAAEERFKRLIKEWALDKKTITLENAGIGKQTGALSISNESSLLSSTFLSLPEKGRDEIKIFSIDDYFKDKAISFVKVDIEGMEFDMLEGARKVIKRDMPKIAISVYHRPDDLIKIYDFLNNLNVGYKFSLRHHSSLLMETVMYCWV